MKVGDEWESKCFVVEIGKGESIDNFLNDKRMAKLLTEADAKKGDFAGNLLKKDVMITVDFDIKRPKHKCRLCGLETQEIPKFAEGECPKGRQHKFGKVNG
jgi:hypothetical protein